MPDRKTASHDKENQITSKSPHDSDNSGLFGEDALVADFQALKPSSTNALESRWSSRSSLFVEERCRMTLSWEDLNVFIKDEANSRKRSTFRLFSCLKRKEIARPKQILKNVTGLAEPGQLLAIMGSSGAGKTTLLNVLTFRNLNDIMIEDTGKVRLNGRPATSNQMRSAAAYVQQQDLFIGTLKVKEHLMFQAYLRMKKGYSEEKKRQRVAEVIQELGLTKCENTLIGIKNRVKGISGGERKRLAFASEIITNPSLMFCDEPTSGLDSFMAVQVVANLKQMALKGRTIIITIHQPSSDVFRLFDKICLLSEGRIAYLGSSKGCLTLFEQVGNPCPANFNPADHFIYSLAVTPGNIKQCHERIKRITAAYERSDEAATIHKQIQSEVDAKNSMSWEQQQAGEDAFVKTSSYNASWWCQFSVLMQREGLSVAREPLVMYVRLINMVTITIVLGLVYVRTELSSQTIQNIIGWLFQMTRYMNFQFVFGCITLFCEQLPIFLRDQQSHMYRVDAYFLAKSLVDLPQYFIFPTMFTVVVFWMTYVSKDPAVFFLILLINILQANTAVSLGTLISAACGDMSLAMTMSTIVVIPLMLFGGFYLNQKSVPVYFRWLQAISYFKYSYEAESLVFWSRIDSIPCKPTFQNETCVANGEEVLESLGMANGDLVVDIIVLIGMIIIYRFLAYISLLIRSYRQ